MPIFPPSGGSSGGRVSYLPGASPFVDDAARDIWAAANLDELLNNSTSVTVITVGATSQQWAGINSPGVYDSSQWFTLSGLSAADVKTLYESNPDTEALSTAKLDVLSRLFVEQPAGKIPVHLQTDLPFMSTLNSIWLGEVLRMSSGGENVFFNNVGRDISYFPAWGALRDHSILINQGPAGIQRVQGRQHSDNMLLFPSGTLNPVGIADLASHVPSNNEDITVFGYDTQLGESIPDGTAICYQGFYGNNATGVKFFDREIITSGFIIDSEVSFPINPPVSIRTGEELFIQIIKPGGALVKGRPTVENPSIPYFIRKYRTWEDKDLAYVDELPNPAIGGGYFIDEVFTTMTLANTDYKVSADFIVWPTLNKILWDNTNKRFEYTGPGDVISFVFNFSAANDTNNTKMHYTVCHNGVAIPGVSASTDFINNNKDQRLGLNGQLALSTGDYIELCVQADAANTVAATSHCQVSIR